MKRIAHNQSAAALRHSEPSVAKAKNLNASGKGSRRDSSTPRLRRSAQNDGVGTFASLIPLRMTRCLTAFAAFASACALALAAFIAVPTQAHAAGIQDGKADLTVASPESGDNTSVVTFGGHEWYVIGYNGAGVNSTENNVTLLAKNNEFGNSAFREGTSSDTDGYTQYTGAIGLYYYINNPAGMTAWKTPIEYAGSTLHQKMESIADEIKANSEDEYALINGRELEGGDVLDGIEGQSLTGQKVWPLSVQEYYTINNEAVCQYGSVKPSTWFWLRTRNMSKEDEARIGVMFYPYVHDYDVARTDAVVRPALTLDLLNVLFTSSASDTDGKATATVGSGFVSAESPTGTLKYTLQSSSQSITVDSVVEEASGSLKLTYSGATTGTGQYVSCVIKDADGNMKYYGKLADCTDSSAASGEATITLPSGITAADLKDGTYGLYVFSEQANGVLYSDFASEPVKAAVSHNWGTTTYEWTSDSSNCTAKRTCSACSATETETAKLGATAVPMVTYAETAATCTEDGVDTYTATFSATWAATQTKDMTLSALGHDYGSAWTSDADGHWHECARCGAAGEKTAHTFTTVTDKAATATEAGSKHEECGVCGYAKAAVEIPATGSSDTSSSSSTASSSSSSSSKATLAKTGDSTAPLAAAAALALAGAALAARVSRARRF